MSKHGRRPLMAGNWKMNGNHLEAIGLTQKLAFSLTEQQLSDVEVVVLPPFIAIRSVQTLVDGDKYRIKYGAQDVSPHPPGPHTGEIAASMLAKLGCSYVTVGHSERRADHHEDNALVNAKVKALVAEKIAPIVCVGEPLEVRREGRQVEHTLAQLDGALDGVGAEQARTVVVAYEPVWAIGTGEVATPEDAQEVCAAIRTRLAELYSGDLADGVRVLYGGSVKASNVAAIMAQEDVDGALVGGASIDGEEFVGIVRYRTAAAS